MVELNQQITWYPEHVKDGQFGKWLPGRAGLVDLAKPLLGQPDSGVEVRRSGLPADRRVRQPRRTRARLRRAPGRPAPAVHRRADPAQPRRPDRQVDDAAHRGRVRRVVRLRVDAVRAGALSVREPGVVRRRHFPGDFIVEYIGQTRGWFYTLHVLATALFDRPAFKTCVAHGIVLGNDGQKMSKSLRNYPDVTEVFDRDGSDAMRWFLMASPILRGGNLVVTEQGIREGVRQVLLPLWNAYTLPGAVRAEEGHLAHRFDERAGPLHPGQARRAARRPDRVAGRLRHLRRLRPAAPVHRGADELVCATVAFAVLGRGPRRHRHAAHRARGDRPAGRAAAAADHRGDLARADRRAVGAPDRLAGGRRSCPPIRELVAAMDQVREVCSAASSLRKAKKLRVRLPLPKLTVAVEDPQRLRAVHRPDRRRAQRQGRRAHRRHRRLRPVRAGRQRQGRGPAARQGRPGRDQGRQGGRGRRQRRRHADRGARGAAARGVQLQTRCGRPGVDGRAARRRGAGGARRHRHRRSWRPRAGPRTASASCRTCASPPDWTCPTGSRW